MRFTLGVCVFVLAATAPASADCTAWTPCVIVVEPASARGLAIDAANVYWADQAGRIFAKTLSGGAPRQLASDQGASVDGVSQGFIYWHTGDAIRKVSVHGGGVTDVVTSFTTQQMLFNCPNANVCAVGSAGSGYELYSFGYGPLPIPLLSAFRTPPIAWSGIARAPDGTTYRWGNGVSSLTSTNEVVLTNTPVFACAASTSVFCRHAHDIINVVAGAAPITLATQQDDDGSIAVDGATLYWTNPRTGSVRKMSVHGGAITTIASGQTTVRNVIIDATSLYWASASAIVRATPK